MKYLAVGPEGNVFLEESEVAVQRSCELGALHRFYPILLDEKNVPSLSPPVRVEDYFNRERTSG